MTTPQSLTEEQIELLASLPIEKEPLDGVGHEVVLQGMGFVGISENRRTYYLTRAGEVLLATLQAERERERERVSGFVAQLESEIPNLADLKHVDNYNNLEANDALLDFAHAMQGQWPANLSPDVLGDQKDKGKATDYADSKESGSVTNEVIPVPTEEADRG
jgi:hypothetical protein